jgi:tetratricopeptide (TPR) repeat protein
MKQAFLLLSFLCLGTACPALSQQSAAAVPAQNPSSEQSKPTSSTPPSSNADAKGINGDLTAARLANKEMRFSDAETLMLKDSQSNPDAVLIWVELGLAQLGLKKYNDAEKSFQKALGVDPDTQKAIHREDYYSENGRTHASRNTADHIVSTTNKLTPDVKGVCYAALGEIYARAGKAAESQAAYDSAVESNPAQAALYLGNETIINFQLGKTEAQLAAAQKAIAVDPNRAMLYYFKAQALASKATIDAKTQKLILPPGCIEAYQKYLALDPNGKFANDAKGVIAASVDPSKQGKS